jgi:hypothetical protein
MRSISSNEIARPSGVPSFKIGGVEFVCFWVGDNGGHYEWRSTDGRRVVGRNVGKSTCWATCDGRTMGSHFLSLRHAMSASVAAKAAA